MPTLDKLNEAQLQELVRDEQSMVEHYKNYGEYARRVKLDNYKPACNGNGGKSFLINKLTHRLALISKGAGLVDYHEESAFTRYDVCNQAFITPLLYGQDQHLNSSLVPDEPDGTQKVWVSLQWRKNEDPDRPGKWDGDERKCDRYVLGQFVIVEKIKKDKFECILLLPEKKSLINTYEVLDNHSTKIMQLEKDAHTHKLQITAMTKSRNFNREHAHKLQAKEMEYDIEKESMDKLQAEIKTKEASIKKMQEDLQGLKKKQHELNAELQKKEDEALYLRRYEVQVKYKLSYLPTLPECDKLTKSPSGYAPIIPAKRGAPD